jgi:activator of 2-hydroxyglutaryl-CoA dehydratase
VDGRVPPVLLKLSLEATKTVPVTAQCSVFAESEVISLISKRHAPPDIAAGVQSAVAKRVFALARRVGVRPHLTLTGGCAKNVGLLATLERVLRTEITSVQMDPQLVGALGAAELALRKLGP